VERSGTPIPESALRSLSIVRLDTPNSSASSAAVKRGLVWTLMSNSSNLAVRDNTFLRTTELGDAICHYYGLDSL